MMEDDELLNSRRLVGKLIEMMVLAAQAGAGLATRITISESDIASIPITPSPLLWSVTLQSTLLISVFHVE